jgi:hypothetical protein
MCPPQDRGEVLGEREVKGLARRRPRTQAVQAPALEPPGGCKAGVYPEQAGLGWRRRSPKVNLPCLPGL